MYQELELWKAEQAKKKAQQEFDKWMTELIKKNGTTKYYPIKQIKMITIGITIGMTYAAGLAMIATMDDQTTSFIRSSSG